MPSTSFVFPKANQEYEEVALSNVLDDERKQAFEQGLAEGYQAGYEKALKEVREQLQGATAQLDQRIAQLALAVTDFQSIYTDQTKTSVLELVTSCCESALRQELSQGPESLAAMVKAGIDKLEARGEVVVRLNSVEVKFIEDFVGSWDDKVRLVADENLSLGQCILESDSQVLELDIPQQLEECLQLVAQKLHE